MKTQTILKLVPLLFLTMQSVQAQEHVGNGGGGLYCPNAVMPQPTLQAYDLAEYRGPWGITAVDSSLKLDIPFYDGVSKKEDYLQKALNKVAATSPSLAEALQLALKVLNQNVQDKGVLSLVNDNHIIFLERGCQYVQLVNWIDRADEMKVMGLPKKRQYVFRDNTLYGQLDPMNQAANDFHEAVYKVKRAFGIEEKEGSTYVRRFVANVFSSQSIKPELLDKISYFDQNEITGIPHTHFMTTAIPSTKFTGAPISYADFDGTAIRFYFGHFCPAKELSQGKFRLTNLSDQNLSYSHMISNVGIAPRKLAPQGSLVLNSNAYQQVNAEWVPIAPRTGLTMRGKPSQLIQIELSACGKTTSTQITLQTPRDGMGPNFYFEIVPFPISEDDLK